jgi:predicted P-loop ATPase
MAGRVVAGGVKADMTPILVGEQGSGKSTGVASMSPAPEFLTEISFGEREDDMARKMRGKLIAELGELRGLHTKELEGIKAFMTRTHEQWIPKFKEFSTTYPRRLVFIGTTNKAEFLADETGHRRWLPMKVGDVRVEDIKRDCLQLWAEARELYKAKGVCYSEAEKLAKEVHHEYEIVDDWEVIIENWLDSIDENTFETYRERGNLTTNEVLTKAFDMKPKDIHSGFTRRCAAILVKFGYVNTKRISNGKQTRVYVLNHMKS